MKLAWDSRKARDRADGKYVREASAQPYHTARWTRLSAAFRAEHPLCAICLSQGKYVPSTCVDHIVPWPVCEDRFFDRSNLQALCDRCNNEKGQRDKAVIAEWRRCRNTAGNEGE